MTKLEKKETSHTDANGFHGLPMTKPLPFAVIEFDENSSLETIRATGDDAEVVNLLSRFMVLW